MEIKEIQARLKDMNLKEVSRLTGIDYYILWRIATGKTARPSFYDMMKLVDFFSGK